MEQIASFSTVEDDAYGPVNLIKLIHRTDEGESKAAYYYDTAAGTQGDQSMKRRIESFKVKIAL